jgi:hypothetical protein
MGNYSRASVGQAGATEGRPISGLKADMTKTYPDYEGLKRD